MASGLFAGRYAIERVLGVGATATVHLARDTQAGIAVAIKIMRPELAQSQATGRFLKEIRRTSALQHPHILRVLDSGEYEDRPYFVLPYMEGGTLRLKLKRESQLSFDDTIGILRTIADALDYAHQKGLIHRDVKPENILFTGGQACLGDFGIARALETVYGTDASTSSNTVRGTYAYMSPEQAAGGMNLDGRSDIYSLACVTYEMITGMQAFIGPTPEAVVAQRFVYTPREVRVYRPSAPPAVDVALSKAFAMAPADRYKTASDFVEVLASAIHAPGPQATMDSRKTPAGFAPTTSQKWFIAAGGAAGIAILAAAVTWVFSAIAPFARDSVQMDTTRLVVLPLERDSSATSPWLDDDLLQQGLARWRGFTVVDQYQVADALRQYGAIGTSDDAAAIAKSLGAGRYIRGRITALGGDSRVTLSLYDASREQSLYQKAANIPKDIAGAVTAYATLADSLLLRGLTADSAPSTSTGSRSLPAIQAFSRALTALDDWDLIRADSGFQSAASYDPEYARASLWLAQVRAWQGQSRNSWGTVAERAVSMVDQLGRREQQLARALLYLDRGLFARACAAYDSLRQRNDHDFAAWYGLGQCRQMNRLVIADPRSPSGWRFQSNTHQAMEAYERAFQVLPVVHRGYERGAFERLQVLLLASTTLHSGYGAKDSALFFARPSWTGDSLFLIPYPWQLVSAGDSTTIPPGFAAALEKQRVQFRRIAAGWSAAYPKSAGAKQAVALSLELLGDPSAIDTVRLARRLAVDASRQLQLAALEVRLSVKFGAPDDLSSIAAAEVLVDSVLAATPEPTASEAQLLATLAALTGRCRDASRLIERSAPASTEPQLRQQLVKRSNLLLAQVSVGCDFLATDLRELIGAIDQAYSNEDERRSVKERLLQRPVLLVGASDRALRANLAHLGASPYVAAADALERADTARVRVLLVRLDRQSSPLLGPLTPDMAMIKAKLWLGIRDTVQAVHTLDESLSNMRLYNPSDFRDLGTSGSLVRAMILYAQISENRKDFVTARRWSAPALRLWTRADAPPRTLLQPLTKYTSQ
ncbi:MAG: serine/threonine-protein kinase [Gemmatimonadaceae bacterium]